MGWRGTCVGVAVALPLLLGVPVTATDTPKDAPATGAVGAEPPAPSAPPPAEAEPAVPDTAAADHVGEQVTIEGRVYATHVSPLATVLAFGPNFSGFTATIQAADRIKFPGDIAERTRNQRVRVRGLVTAYRGHPEMTLRDPAQIVLLTPTGAAAADRPMSTPTPDAAAEVTHEALARIAARLRALEARVAALEAVPSPAGDAAEVPVALALGMRAVEVRTLLGEPLGVEREVTGGEVWAYGDGRLVSFDIEGRVAAWSGF
jgi:hypothetical protein